MSCYILCRDWHPSYTLYCVSENHVTLSNTMYCAWSKNQVTLWTVRWERIKKYYVTPCTVQRVTLWTVHWVRIKGLSAMWQLSYCSFENPTTCRFCLSTFMQIFSPTNTQNCQTFLRNAFTELSDLSCPSPDLDLSLDSLKTANSYQPRIQRFQISHAPQPSSRSEDWGCCCLKSNHPTMHNLWGKRWRLWWGEEGGEYLAECLSKADDDDEEEDEEEEAD